MSSKRKTKITVETERVLIISRSDSFVQTWCARCRQQAHMLTPTEAAALTGNSPLSICRQMDAGILHFTETTEGLRLICLNSLL